MVEVVVAMVVVVAEPVLVLVREHHIQARYFSGIPVIMMMRKSGTAGLTRKSIRMRL